MAHHSPMTTTNASISEVRIDHDVHVSGLGANLHKLTADQRRQLASFRVAVGKLKEAADQKDYLESDAPLVRFLIARNWDIPKSLKMITQALQWRNKRPCHRWNISEDEERAALFKFHSSPGKIRVRGVDIHGRPVMVFDNSRENATAAQMKTESMQFLAYNMSLCERTAQSPADKIMLFMHMTEFSFFNQPPMAVTLETITILSVSFPESLGTCVIMNPPAAFRILWNAVSGFIDPRTKSKIFLLSGDISDGSANDQVMRRIVGPNWKVLTGAGQPVKAKAFSRKTGKMIPSSPGFDVDEYWPTVMQREQAWAAKQQQQRLGKQEKEKRHPEQLRQQEEERRERSDAQTPMVASDVQKLAGPLTGIVVSSQKGGFTIQPWQVIAVASVLTVILAMVFSSGEFHWAAMALPVPTRSAAQSR